MVVAMEDTSVSINDSIEIKATGSDPNGTVKKYLWAKNGTDYLDTTIVNKFKTEFPDSGRHIVRVKVIDNDGLFSLADEVVITVRLDAPIVTTMKNVNTYINDSITITATATDNGTIVWYFWALDGLNYRDSTGNGAKRVVFPDSGRHVVKVKAKDNDGVFSQPDSCIVTVNLGQPLVKAMKDSSVNINDSITITAIGTDSNGTVVKYIWAKNGTFFNDTTTTGVYKTTFSDSGRQVVRVKVKDNDGVLSKPDSCLMRVTLDPPVVSKKADITVSQSTTVTIHVSAEDANVGGRVVKYYWDIGANGWDDSTAIGQHDFSKSSGGSDTIVWAVRDDDGIMSAKDTFIIRFNRPPTGAAVTVSTEWVSFNVASGKGTFLLTLSASDADLPYDTLSYTLSLGSSAGSLAQVYSGRLTQYLAANNKSSDTVNWRLSVHDLYGDSVVESGLFFAPPAGMRFISGGTFQMGQVGIAEPVHSVTVSSFYIDTTEVTQKAYSDLMSATYSGFNPPVWSSYGVGDNFPAYSVNWYDAVLFCNARSKRDKVDTVYSYSSISGTPGNGCVLNGLNINIAKNSYRLPTEAEWEYACRAGTTTKCFWGDDSSAGGNYAWSSINYSNTTHSVATRLPNLWGLYDMIGNSWEWCNDWFGSYPSASQIDPTGATTGTNRVLRGGSCADLGANLRSANHYSDSPDYRNSGDGFRVVYSR
jgi:formylglycine-generating enzyme required for sulfatase activity